MPPLIRSVRMPRAVSGSQILDTWSECPAILAIKFFHVFVLLLFLLRNVFFCKFSESLPSISQNGFHVGKPFFVQFDQKCRGNSEQRFLVGKYSNVSYRFFFFLFWISTIFVLQSIRTTSMPEKFRCIWQSGIERIFSFFEHRWSFSEPSWPFQKDFPA